MRVTRAAVVCAAALSVLWAPGCGKDEPVDPAGNPVKGDPEAPAPDERSPGRELTFTVKVEATFEGLPEGARVLAPSARDRRFLKVTKSEHSGIKGSVVGTSDGANLFFVSEPLPAGGATYTASFQAAARVLRAGSIEGVGDAPAEGTPKVGDLPTDEALVAAAKGLEADTPAKVVLAAVKLVEPIAVDPAGSDEAGATLSAKKGSELGLARATADLLKLRGVPARLVQGWVTPRVEGAVSQGSAWLEAQLPRLGWAPVDPARLRQGERAPDSDVYLGSLPIDRLTLVSGDAVTLTLPDGSKLEVSGRLAEPFALSKEGARVGKVTWTATFAQAAGK